ncbi:MAG TPA: alkaline phosphatase family protein [Verrucomicrobiae bacterium]|nr:alkaline phosphatase family protein [Verrucomicrobiae bacterium]
MSVVEGNSRRVLLIGWDAADWRVIHPLMDAGKMPALRSLVDGGVSANLATLQPMYSPMLWTSIATGKRAFKHGVHGFTEPTPDGTAVRPVSNLSRKCKAIWNILNQEGMRSIVVGWWPSHPAEPINGAMVSNHFQTAIGPPDQPWPLPPGSVHPPRVADALADLRINPNELGTEEILPFIPRAAEINQDKDRRLASCAKILAECSTIHAAATLLLEREPWDFAAIYYDAIDHFSHGFMRYHPPRRESVPEKDFDLYSGVIEAAYRYHDLMLRALLRLAGPDTTVILMSDHGFHPDHLRPKGIPLEPAGPAIEHRELGILAIRGPGIRRDELIHGANLLDIAPTILTLFGLPIGSDMDGKPLTVAFESPPTVQGIPSWEKIPGEDGRHPDGLQLDPEAAREALEQLIALGYIERPAANARQAVERTMREQRYNLARAYMDANRHFDATPLLEGLWKSDPAEFRFGAQLALCYRAIGRTADMRRVIEETRDRRREDASQAREKLRTRLEELQKSGSPTTTPEAGDSAADRRASLRSAIDGLPESERRELSHLRARAQFHRLPIDYLEGLVNLDEGHLDEAAACFGRAEKTDASLPGVHVQLGEARLRLRKPDDAERSFNRALELDPENAHAFAGLARAHLQRRRPYDAASAALQSIGLLYQNPMAHYILGVALWRLRRFQHAVTSLEVAIALNPNFAQAHRRLAFLFQRHLRQPARAAEHRRLAQEARTPPAAHNPPPDTHGPEPSAQQPAPSTPARGAARRPAKALVVGGDAAAGPIADDAGLFITVVSGLPRSGTSLIMQMLAAGGHPILADDTRSADEDNPLGYLEFEPVTRLRRDHSWLPNATGKAVKIVAPLLPLLPATQHYRVIFMERDINEVIRSQRTMLERQGKEGARISDERLAQALSRQVLQIKELLRMRPQFRTLYVGHREAISNPAATAARIASFLGKDLDAAAMAAIVRPELHRQRRKPEDAL